MSRRIITYDDKILIPAENKILLYEGNIPNPLIWLNAGNIEYNLDNKVAIIYDLSGNGFNAFQQTETEKPIVYLNYFNQQPAIYFNGSSQWMSIALSDILQIPMTYFVVFETLSNGTHPAFGGSYGHIIGTVDNVRTGMYGGAWLTTPVQPPFPMSLWQGVFNGHSSFLYYNGNLVNSGNAGTLSMTTPLYIGRYQGPSPQWGHIMLAEVIVYRGVLSLMEKVLVDNYLKQKYGFL